MLGFEIKAVVRATWYNKRKEVVGQYKEAEKKGRSVELSSVEVMRNTRWYICILF